MAMSELHEAIDESLRRFGSPGAVIGISRRGEHEMFATGFASIESELPVLESILVRVASITKPMTATLIMALVTEKLIDLDRPVHEYVPDVMLGDGPTFWQMSITMRHLLSHRSGFDCELIEDLGKLGMIPAHWRRQSRTSIGFISLRLPERRCLTGTPVTGWTVG